MTHTNPSGAIERNLQNPNHVPVNSKPTDSTFYQNPKIKNNDYYNEPNQPELSHFSKGQLHKRTTPLISENHGPSHVISQPYSNPYSMVSENPDWSIKLDTNNRKAERSKTTLKSEIIDSGGQYQNNGLRQNVAENSRVRRLRMESIENLENMEEVESVIDDLQPRKPNTVKNAIMMNMDFGADSQVDYVDAYAGNEQNMLDKAITKVLLHFIIVELNLFESVSNPFYKIIISKT